jgi:hypothetical protein
MAYVLWVRNANGDTESVDLADGKYRLGSRKGSEVLVSHPEVQENAAIIEVRGGAVFLRNLNPFPIYVGDEQIESNDQTEWRPGLTVLLTQSISLQIESLRQSASDRDEAEKAKRKRSMNQWIVIGICSFLGFYFLVSDSAPKDSTRQFQFSFNDLVKDLTEKPASDYRLIRNYLTDARMADIRWGRENPKRAISSYQLLLDERRIRDANPDEETLEGRIKVYALARVDDLSSLLRPE